MKALRLMARVIVTPVFVLAFGFMWIGFVLVIGLMFQVFSFLEGEHFEWDAHLKECNQFFCDPLIMMWGSKRSRAAEAQKS